ncbi:MAG TPA: OmpA family protein [Methylophilaceae bacterium]|jgi:OOP family OmpA-OmpF porin
MKNNAIKLAVAGVLALTAFSAMAEGAYDGSWYAVPGVSAMVTDTDLSANTIGPGVFLRLGKELSEHWDVQAGVSYAQSHQATGIPGASGRFKQTLLGVDALYMFSRDKLRPFLLAGVGAAQNNMDYSIPSVNTDIDTTSWMANVGLGVQYLFSDNLGLQADVRQVYSRISGSTVGTGLLSGLGGSDNTAIGNTLLNLGGIYRWGGAKPVVEETPAPAPAPAPVAALVEPTPEPAPAPVPAPEACKPTFETVTVSAEKLFGFDKSALKAEGKATLDDAAAKIIANPALELVMVTGHTDRIGSDKYNQKLSERRANQVKAYLVSKGIAAERLHAVGKGESEPVVECKGVKGKKLIECLQPNRRVVLSAEKQVETDTCK